MIGRFFRILLSGTGITLLVTVVVSALLWFLGPFVGFGSAHPLETLTGRLIGLAIVWILALIAILILLLTAKKRDDAMTGEIVGTVSLADTGVGEVVGAELSEMQEKLRAALSKLRRSKLGRRHLYEIPWYIIIGPPGAGKTTAIVNSGLKFPLADEVGAAAVSGVGGTRNCDWWFTDNAVLVDTAGRYTTQDADSDVDNAAWLGFLKILKKYRKRQPINGAIVAISLSDLSQQDELTQKSHAAAVRRRLQELRERLGVRFPVYVLFTKADLIAGFTEFFEAFSKEEREQVWGFTLPLAKARGDAAPISLFDEEFGLLLARLNNLSLVRMHGESDPQRRSLIASFPSQVASVRIIARDFLAEVFQENRYEHRQMLRGVYFASGTQEGTPIDRLMMGMARTFGIGRQAIGSGRGTGRSYFLTRLFDEVIFREAGLVSVDSRVERRYRWTQRAAVASTVLAAAAVGFFWARSYAGNRELIAASVEQLDTYRQATAELPKGPIKDADLRAVTPALNILRDLPEVSAETEQTRPDGLGWGLYQGDVIGNEARQAYRASLNQQFLPRLLLKLEDYMLAHTENPDALYEALKIYLMLGLYGEMSPQLVKEWMAENGGSDRQLPNFEAHLDALLTQPMQKIELNAELVTKIQQILAKIPQAQRVYNGIINSPEATGLPPWRLTDIGGPMLAEAMVRTSGKPLNEGIEGIFTYSGFNDVFLDEVLGVAKRIQRDSWILGPMAETDQSQASLVALSRDVLGIYYNDFVSRYDTLLGDLDIVPLESLQHAVDVTAILAGSNSPITRILEAVARETKLTQPPLTPEPPNEAPEGGVVADAAAAVATTKMLRRLNPDSLLFLDALTEASASSGGEPQVPGAYVEQRFEWLDQLVTRPDGQASPLDALMESLVEVYNELNTLKFADSAVPQGNSTALAKFVDASSRLPGPIQRWAAAVVKGSSGIAAGGTRAGLNALWQSSVLPLCEKATADAYPFFREAKTEISIRDFGDLFGPGGKIDTFFAENLSKIVNTTAQPWEWKPVNGADLGIPPEVLLDFQRAAAIRDAFFAGSTTPAVQFQINLEALLPSAIGVLLEIDSRNYPYKFADGIPRPAAFTWPGEVGMARVTFVPAGGGPNAAIARDGPWAWFRLMDIGKLTRTSASDRTKVTFASGEFTVVYLLTAGSVLNAFALPALREFRCPTAF